jgi:hypothetical protein
MEDASGLPATGSRRRRSMNENTAERMLGELKAISRAMGFLCVATGPCANQSLGVQARVLKSIGWDNTEIAELLNSTPNSIAVRLSETKSWRGRLVKDEE